MFISCFNHNTLKWSKSSSQCRSELNWPELSTRRNFLSLLTLHDIPHERIALKFSDFFTYSSSCTRSHPFTLYCKSSTVNSFRYSFFINSVFLWNKICTSIASISDRVIFKNQLYNFLTTLFFVLYLIVQFVPL